MLLAAAIGVGIAGFSLVISGLKGSGFPVHDLIVGRWGLTAAEQAAQANAANPNGATQVPVPGSGGKIAPKDPVTGKAPVYT